jgi:hypothetical protein
VEVPLSEATECHVRVFAETPPSGATDLAVRVSAETPASETTELAVRVSAETPASEATDLAVRVSAETSPDAGEGPPATDNPSPPFLRAPSAPLRAGVSAEASLRSLASRP